MDDLYKLALFYDFYGELLTKSQRQIYGLHVIDDLSFSEIAVSLGLSRQAIHDSVGRTKKKLEAYEDKLRLVERFVTIKSNVKEIETVLTAYENKERSQESYLEMMEKIRGIAQEILEDI